MTVLAVFPDLFLSSFIDGLVLFGSAVLPALFPFMFLTKTLTDLGLVETLVSKLDKPFFSIFRAPAVGLYIFLMSAVCGYPVGTKVMSDIAQAKSLTKSQTEQLLPFCSTSGPLFVVGTVGTQMFSNKMLGFVVFGIHLLACILCALFIGWVRYFFSKHKQKQNPQPSNPPVPLDNILSKNMIDTCQSILIVGGFVSTFYLLIDILCRFGILMPLNKLFSFFLKSVGLDTSLSTGLATGFVEMTRGCRDVSLVPTSAATPIALVAIITFSGLSILMQSWAFLSKANVSFKKFLGIKLLQTTFAVLIALPIFLI